jgi:hypothetical protein
MEAVEGQGLDSRPADVPEVAPAVFALPRLGPRAFAVFRIVWLLALALALTALTVGNYRIFERSRERPFSHLGLGWYDEQGEMRLMEPFTPEARRAGIQRGQTIVAVDGHPVGSSITSAPAIQSLLKRPEGSAVRLTTRSPDGRLANHHLTRSEKHIDEGLVGTGISQGPLVAITSAAALLPDLFLLLAAALLFRGARSGAVSALLSLSLVLMVTFDGGAWVFYQTDWLLPLRDVLNNAALTGMLISLLAFPDGRFHPRWTLAAAAVVAGWGIGSYFLPSTAILNYIWTLLLAVCLVAVAGRYRRLPDGRERLQVRWALLGFGWGVVLLAFAFAATAIGDRAPDHAVATRLWFPLIGIILGALATSLFAAGLLISLMRYRLYDVDAIISRSAAFGLLTLGFLAIFAGSEKAIETLGERYYGSNAGAVSGALAAALAAIVIGPLHKRLHGWAERRFQKGLLRLRRDVPDCVNDLKETAPIEELADDVLGRVMAGVRASRAAMLLHGDVAGTAGISSDAVAQWQSAVALQASAETLDCDRSDSVFPLRVPLRVAHAPAAEPLGWMLLGPRPDGSFYGKDERETLAAIADPIARALRRAGLRIAREASLERRLRAIEARLTRRSAGPGRRQAAAAE